ncbi:MAG: hypothetical protein QG568_738 [Patescibacteria group bacterium]|nr:hypothetical protein [Patescibacteria group bacterium]
MFLGVSYKSLAFATGSSFVIALVGAFSEKGVSQSADTFLGLFLFVFVWSLIIGVTFLQERVSDDDYRETMDSNVPHSSELLGVFQASLWLRRWHVISGVHRYTVLVLIQTLFVLGFYFLHR